GELRQQPAGRTVQRCYDGRPGRGADGVDDMRIVQSDDVPLPISRDLEADVLALNNAHAAELSWLDRDQLAPLLGEASYARRVGTLDAFLLAFDEGAAYASPNYLWFRARHARFVYIDRVVVAPAARGRGLARLLYADLFRHAARAGHDLA